MALYLIFCNIPAVPCAGGMKIKCYVLKFIDGDNAPRPALPESARRDGQGRAGRING